MDAVLPLNNLSNLAISGKSILFFGEAMSRLSAFNGGVGPQELIGLARNIIIWAL